MVIPTPSTSLSGLGCDCSSIDDNGNCLDPDPCSSPTNTYGASTGTVSLPGFGPLPVQTPVQAGETVVPSATPTAPNTTQATGMTAAQYQLYSQILSNAGTIGKELALTPGTTVSANGAVSQQNPGYPIAGTGIAQAFNSSSFLPIAMVGILALLLMKR
jgi:hypothetical protein